MASPCPLALPRTYRPAVRLTPSPLVVLLRGLAGLSVRSLSCCLSLLPVLLLLRSCWSCSLLLLAGRSVSLGLSCVCFWRDLDGPSHRIPSRPSSPSSSPVSSRSSAAPARVEVSPRFASSSSTTPRGRSSATSRAPSVRTTSLPSSSPSARPGALLFPSGGRAGTRVAHGRARLQAWLGLRAWAGLGLPDPPAPACLPLAVLLESSTDRAVPSLLAAACPGLACSSSSRTSRRPPSPCRPCPPFHRPPPLPPLGRLFLQPPPISPTPPIAVSGFPPFPPSRPAPSFVRPDPAGPSRAVLLS